MYERILVAYDGSMMSRDAINHAKTLAKQEKETEIIIISVVESTGVTTNVNISRSILQELKEKLQPQMNAVQKELTAEGYKVSTDILLNEDRDNPGELICEYIDRQNIDLVVMGSRGLGNIKKIFLGSVSNYIVQHAECPVLVIK